MVRKFAAQFLGTALLVYFAVGVASLSFGFGATGASFAVGRCWPSSMSSARFR